MNEDIFCRVRKKTHAITLYVFISLLFMYN